MANQSITSGTVNYDAAAISGLLNGEQITISGGATLRIDADTNWNQQAAAFGTIAPDTTSGGNVLIDGRDLWEVPFSASSGNVPTQAALGSNGVTGGTSGATGELTRVWATGSLTPAAAGGAMPATGYIKLRSKTGTFAAGETISLPGGATVTASGAGKRSWMQVMQSLTGTFNLNTYSTLNVQGDWYELGVTQGLDNEIIQAPFTAPIYGIQIETSPGSGVYEWWANYTYRMNAYAQTAYFENNTTNGTVTRTLSRPTSWVEPNGFMRHPTTFRETTATGAHEVFINSSAINAGTLTGRAYLKQDTRQWGFVTLARSDFGIAYGVVVDLSTGTVASTISVGSPTGTSSTVTALADGSYQIDVTVTAADLTTWTVRAGPSNSATPTISAARPSYAGTTTQGVIVHEVLLIGPQNVTWVETDARGKFFSFNAINGQIKLAVRTGRSNGAKPPAGCKVRVGNVCWGRSDSRDWNTDALIAPSSSPGGLNSFITANFLNIRTFDLGSVTGANFTNTCLYIGSGSPTARLAKDSTWDGGVMTHFMESGSAFGLRNNIGRFILRNFRMISDNNFAVQQFEFNNLTNLVIENCDFVWFPDRFRNNNHQLNTCVLFNDVTGATITNISVLGGQMRGNNFRDSTIDGLAFGTNANGVTTTAFLSYAVRFANSSNITIKDFKAYGAVSGLQPTISLFETSSGTGAASKITIRDIGTRAAPYNLGSGAARCGAITAMDASEVKLMRLNFSGTGDVGLNRAASPTFGYDFLAQDVTFSDGTTASQNTGLSIRRGVRALSPTSTNYGSTNIFGVHFDDTFSSNTQGRITLLCFDPVPKTADQFSFSAGARGTSGTGELFIINVGDTATWTMPYYSLGHTGIAKFTGGASATETWLLDSVTPENFEATYQIDTGSGFSASKWLFSIGVRASGGTAGTNTVTLTTATWNAMTRKPAVGDFIQGSSANVPAGTTITAVSGQTLTLSANILTTFTGTAIYFWKDIANEAISPSGGFKLRVTVRCNTASFWPIKQIRIPTDTTLAAQTDNLYPIPTLSVTGLIPNSRVKVSRVDTGALLAQKSSGSDTSVVFELGYAGLVQVEARNASGSPTYKPWITQTIANLSSITTVVALQERDD